MDFNFHPITGKDLELYREVSHILFLLFSLRGIAFVSWLQNAHGIEQSVRETFPSIPADFQLKPVTLRKMEACAMIYDFMVSKTYIFWIETILFFTFNI